VFDRPVGHFSCHPSLTGRRRSVHLARESRWPGGARKVLNDVSADQILQVDEPAAAPRPSHQNSTVLGQNVWGTMHYKLRSNRVVMLLA
jgi:hypothetical protein